MNNLVQFLRGRPPQIVLPALPPQVRQRLGALRRRIQRYRRVIAVTGSVLLHLLLLLILFSHAPKGLPGGGSGGTEVGAGTGETYIAVDLSSLSLNPAATMAVRTPDDPAAEALDQPTETVKPQPEAVQIATALSQAVLPEVAPATPADASAAAQPAAAAVGGAGQGGATAGAGDDLWKAIAPCWDRVAGKDTLPVVLKITFGATGGLSKPPQIVRGDTAPITPQSLRSEAQAMAALAQCGGYPMAANRQEVEVDFPRPE